MKVFVLLLALWLPDNSVTVYTVGLYQTEKQCWDAVKPAARKALEPAPNGSLIDAGCALFIKEDAV